MTVREPEVEDATSAQAAVEGNPHDPPQIFAAPSFGIWVANLRLGGKLLGYGKANSDMTEWCAGDFWTFPLGRLSRKVAHAPLGYLRTFRNRIAHHEPKFERHHSTDDARLLQIDGLISKGTRARNEHKSRLLAILGLSPDDTDLLF